jgi:hypothetical protein
MAPKPEDIKLPKPKPRNTDWDAVERDYRTGKFTLRELAEKYSVAHQTVDGHIKRKGWTQDLSDVIRQATNTRLVDELVSNEADKNRQDADSVIGAAVEVNVRVIMGHRAGLSRLSRVKDLLLNQVEQQAANLPELSEIIEIVRSPDENGRDRANDMLRRAMERSTLVDDLKKLAEIDERVRKGEREAFSLNAVTPASEGDSMAAFLADLSARGSRLPTGAAQ